MNITIDLRWATAISIDLVIVEVLHSRFPNYIHSEFRTSIAVLTLPWMPRRSQDEEVIDALARASEAARFQERWIEALRNLKRSVNNERVEVTCINVPTGSISRLGSQDLTVRFS